MTLTEVYRTLDVDIKPHIDIYLNMNDSSYRHAAYFPPRWMDEDYLSIEFNPYTSEVINYYPTCD